MAGLGRLPEAVQFYSQFQNQPGAPSWLFKSHLSTLYNIAGDHDKAIALIREAIAEKPDGILHVDLANHLARYKKDPAGARAALQQLDMSVVPEVAKPFVTRCRGIVAWLEGDYQTARQELETAVRLMEVSRHLPFMNGLRCVAKGYLCCVYGKLGDLEAARRHYCEARAYLTVTKETELLGACEGVVAEGGGGMNRIGHR
jgi:tetratricopeptide (TPR) repeat protein